MLSVSGKSAQAPEPAVGASKWINQNEVPCFEAQLTSYSILRPDLSFLNGVQRW